MNSDVQNLQDEIKAKANVEPEDLVDYEHPVFRVGEVLTIKGLQFRLVSCGQKCLSLSPLPGVDVQVVKAAPVKNRRRR